MAKKRIAVFGVSADPPAFHHKVIVETLAEQDPFFDRVIVVPCGPRPDKRTVENLDPIHRATMLDMTLRNIRNTRIDLFDLEHATFTRTRELDELYRKEGELWHVVGADWVVGGARGRSNIHRVWEHGKELWKTLRFAVLTRKGFELSPADLPPHSHVVRTDIEGSSTDIRSAVWNHESIAGLVMNEVEDYIIGKGIYQGHMPSQERLWKAPRNLCAAFVVDGAKPAARGIYRQLRHLEIDPKFAYCIIVIGGDGTMLHAIRKYWRLRLPFIGINVGTVGFLLNDKPRGARSWERLLRKQLTLWQMPLLFVTTEAANGKKREALGFNDAWVERATSQSAWIKVFGTRNDRTILAIDRMVSDGALVATPAGSTAYARAMGATPLLINAPSLQVVGNNVAHPLGWKCMNVSSSASVTLETLDPDKRPVIGYVDGVKQGRVIKMTIRQSRIAAAEIAFLPDRDIAAKHSAVQYPKA